MRTNQIRAASLPALRDWQESHTLTNSIYHSCEFCAAVKRELQRRFALSGQ